MLSSLAWYQLMACASSHGPDGKSSRDESLFETVKWLNRATRQDDEMINHPLIATASAMHKLLSAAENKDAVPVKKDEEEDNVPANVASLCVKVFFFLPFFFPFFADDFVCP